MPATLAATGSQRPICDFTISLTADAVDAMIVARNVGTDAEPIAIGWHPYFNFPSGDRTQARLQIPASMLATVDNYDNVFPTGKLVPVTGQYDLRAEAASRSTRISTTTTGANSTGRTASSR